MVVRKLEEKLRMLLLIQIISLEEETLISLCRSLCVGKSGRQRRSMGIANDAHYHLLILFFHSYVSLSCGEIFLKFACICKIFFFIIVRCF